MNIVDIHNAALLYMVNIIKKEVQPRHNRVAVAWRHKYPLLDRLRLLPEMLFFVPWYYLH